MYRIGTVNIDTSHAPSFAGILLKDNIARYSAVYNDAFRTDEEVNAFIEKYGLEKRYYSLEEMAKNIDIAFIQGCNWDRHIECMLPFVRAGVPVFVDKPLVGNVKDLNKIQELSDNGAAILGTSALRYTYEHDGFFAIAPESRGDIVHVSTMVGVDEFNYAIHSVESIMGFIKDSAPESVRYIGTSKVGDTPCDSYYILFKNGASACYHICLKGWQPSTALVMTTKTSFAYRIDINKVYEAMLKQVCNWLLGKENNLCSVSQMCDSIRIMLAGKKSKTNGGTNELISDLNESDEGFDGAQFEIEYAAQQRASKK
ncbi:MAG: Gfo/Idh/MocA family oxidoreductase, partial [Eubacteriales bacterium]|nr:Gfo/Idh/MocA family oxidoreductase [Eubacteriales bacterium]MDD4421939.1 Gfo/Idh/MocA family oxidoreductase [Eubacteriales bacterium]HBR30758.1 hypothetical protein [Clostridiales bacterium]